MLKLSSGIAIIFIAISYISYPFDNKKSIQPFYVEWIDTYSNEHNLRIDKGFFRKVIDLVIGKKDFLFSKPVNLIAYDTSKMFILDRGIQKIIYFNYPENKLELFGEKDFLPSLTGISEWINDNVLITDSKNNMIYIINPTTSEISIFGDSIKLSQPTGIAYNKARQEIVVAETNQHRLKILNNQGQVLRTIGSRGKDTAEFNFPTFMTFDNQNRLYVVDALNFRIQVFDKDYNVISIFGEQGDASGYFASPKGIAVDSYGHIYVADALFHTVQIFDINGNYLSNFGSQGREDGKFLMPTGISIDKNNKIYVADSYNSRIQVFQLLEDY